MTKRWYVVHAYANFENKVAEYIKEKAELEGLQDFIGEIVVPTEKSVSIKGGKKIEGRRRFFPGYVMIKMEMTDAAYHLVRNTPKVSGLLGEEKKPIPLSDAEATKILKQIEEGVVKPASELDFEVGQQVRVSDGPFASFNGLIEEVDLKQKRVKVAVSIFGRPTPVELSCDQLEKI